MNLKLIKFGIFPKELLRRFEKGEGGAWWWWWKVGRLRKREVRRTSSFLAIAEEKKKLLLQFARVLMGFKLGGRMAERVRVGLPAFQ